MAYLHIPRLVDALFSEIRINVRIKDSDYLVKIDYWWFFVLLLMILVIRSALFCLTIRYALVTHTLYNGSLLVFVSPQDQFEEVSLTLPECRNGINLRLDV